MADIIAPEVHPGGNVFVGEQFLHARTVFLHRMFPGASAAAQDDVPVAVEIHEGMIQRHAVNVIHRRVGIDQVIEIVGEEETRIVGAGQGDAAGKSFRCAEQEVEGVGAAHGAAGCQDALRAEAVVFPADFLKARTEFVHDVVEILFLGLDAGAVVRVGGAPGVIIVAVAAEHLDAAVFDERGQAADEAVVLEVIKASALAGKSQHGLAGAAVELEFHIASQGAAVFLEVLSIHLPASAEAFFAAGFFSDSLPFFS